MIDEYHESHVLMTKNVFIYILLHATSLLQWSTRSRIIHVRPDTGTNGYILMDDKNFRHRRSHGRRGKGIGESGAAGYTSEPAQKNARIRWRIRVPLKRTEFTTPKCVVYCVSRKTSTKRIPIESYLLRRSVYISVYQWFTRILRAQSGKPELRNNEIAFLTLIVTMRLHNYII